MKFQIERSSDKRFLAKEPPVQGAIKEHKDGFYFWTKEFNTLDELLDLMESEEEDIVITRNSVYNRTKDIWPEYCIEIYDDYRE